MPDYERAARFLFDLLDDIDSCDDIAKSDDKLYRGMVEKVQRRRFEVADVTPDDVVFNDGTYELRRSIDFDNL